MASEGGLRSMAAEWIGIACQKTGTRLTGRACDHTAHQTSDQSCQGPLCDPPGISEESVQPPQSSLAGIIASLKKANSTR